MIEKLKIPGGSELADRLRAAVHLSPLQRRLLLRSTALAFGVRMGLILAGYIVGYIILGREDTAVTEIIRETFHRWDAPIYELIAEKGYEDSDEQRLYIVFFPLYPFTVKIVQLVIPSFIVAGLLVSAIAAVAAGYFLQSLILRDGGSEEEADRGLWYFFLFPTGYFLAMPYTEALFMATTLGSFYAARERRWAWSGWLGMLAALTRMQGALLAPALAFEAFQSERWHAIPRAFWLGLVPVGLLFYLLLNYAVLGDAFAFMDIQKEHWQHEFQWPWETLRESQHWILDEKSGPTRTSIYELRAAAVVIAIALLAIGVRWLRPSYQVFAWASLIFFLSVSFQISLPRYVLTLFPMYMVLARLGSSPTTHQALLSISVVLMGALFVVYATRWGF